MKAMPLRIAGMISGGGRTLMNLASHIDRGELAASIELVIASRENIAGVALARERGLDVRILPKNAPDDHITRWLLEKNIDLVCMAGYLRLMRVDPPFRGRVMNIHPSLLPKFGGRGMYGLYVHRAVLAAGEKVSGCTVHFVDEQYDRGPIILQRTCPVLPSDDEHTLAARVFEQECLAYPEAVQLFAAGRLTIERGTVRILEPKA
ncbi:MAG TPA: phosphoribosylglycinamide formyltransferase [Phycisphaerales bacterium]|nr:phosphoribosylglycinamide formyltransferase [Phycisphaerales bacterium]HRQ75976.1 phosphoribosylglycinamide formyltransferase [Phycisphaerales bacterium]